MAVNDLEPPLKEPLIWPIPRTWVAWMTRVSNLVVALRAGAITSSSPSGGVGYGAGAGGTIGQATSKSTAVVLHKVCGQITMNNAALAADAVVSFTLTNTTIAATDLLLLNHVATGTFGAYTFNARCAAGSAILDVANRSTGALSEAIVIRFALMRAVIT